MSYAPFIVVPPLTSCKDSYLVFGQGTAPYTLYPIPSGDGNGTLLQNLPKQATAGYYEWFVDFNAGANLTFVLVDGAGSTAYSEWRVVQANEHGANYSCPTTKDLPTHSSNPGAIAGGVIGGLAVLALILVTVFWVRRRANRAAPPSPFLRGDSYDHDPATAQAGTGTGGATGVRRAGTFNLHQVEFHPDSVVELRALDPPPNYIPGAAVVPKRRIGAWRRAVAAASGASGAGASGEREHEAGVADEDAVVGEGQTAGATGTEVGREDGDGMTLKDDESAGERSPAATHPSTLEATRVSAEQLRPAEGLP